MKVKERDKNEKNSGIFTPCFDCSRFLVPGLPKSARIGRGRRHRRRRTASTGELRTLLKREEPGHKTTVVIDPGHGFGDVGAAGPETPLGCYEYELTAEMGLTLRDYLEERGYIVYMTHDGSTFPPFQKSARWPINMASPMIPRKASGRTTIFFLPMSGSYI